VKLKTKLDKIIEALKDSNISEIEISSFWGAQKIKLKTALFRNDIFTSTTKENHSTIKNDTITQTPDESYVSKVTEESTEITSTELIDSDELTTIKAPLVGTFYASSKPGETAFVEKGKVLKVGDPLCIVEAMKIFNTIESEYTGEVIDVLVQDGDPVEFGQELFLIKEIDV
jgi:acetyl-CoA carboxylase biotin carboxyl carrier protein